MQGSAQPVRRVGPGAARRWPFGSGSVCQRGEHRNQRGKFLVRRLTPHDVDNL
jgi:hypothetical protein